MAVYLINFQGTLMTGAEQFQHSIVVDAAGSIGGEMQSTVLDAAEDALDALMHTTTGAAPMIPSTTVYTNVRVARVLSLEEGTLQSAVNRSVTKAGTGSGALPPQLAVCVSLAGGDKGNGLPYRGRFYMPGPASNRVADGIMTSAARDQYGLGVEGMLAALTIPLSNIAPQIWSRKFATTATVEQARIGRALDTVRSRRRSIPEQYAVVSP